ncbi:MAG: hypothetical protein SR1Q7_05675 [Quinella sp. 1Q7]|nr:hypothetical protein [Quinella sp. 1Q7]
MAGVVEELNELVRQDTTISNMINMAKKLLVDGGMSIEKISSLCELPLEKVRELAANISAQPKESN